MRDKMRRHLEWVSTLPVLPFSLILAAYSLALRVVPAIVVAAVMVISNVPVPAAESPIDVPWYWVLLIGPTLETVALQWFPIAIMSRVKAGMPVIVGVSAGLFTAAHCGGGIVPVLAAAPPGTVLAWAFLVRRNRGLKHAFWTTALIHSWINVAALAARWVLD